MKLRDKKEKSLSDEKNLFKVSPTSDGIHGPALQFACS